MQKKVRDRYLSRIGCAHAAHSFPLISEMCGWVVDDGIIHVAESRSSNVADEVTLPTSSIDCWWRWWAGGFFSSSSSEVMMNEEEECIEKGVKGGGEEEEERPRRLRWLGHQEAGWLMGGVIDTRERERERESLKNESYWGKEREEITNVEA